MPYDFNEDPLEILDAKTRIIMVNPVLVEGAWREYDALSEEERSRFGIGEEDIDKSHQKLIQRIISENPEEVLELFFSSLSQIALPKRERSSAESDKKGRGTGVERNSVTSDDYLNVLERQTALENSLLTYIKMGLIDPLYIVAASKIFSPEKGEWLLDHLGSVNHPDSAGNTPLHIAVMNGNAAAAQWLLERGADLKMLNGEKMTPLQMAVRTGNSEIVDILIEGMSKDSIKATQSATRAQVSADKRQTQRVVAVLKKIRERIHDEEYTTAGKTFKKNETVVPATIKTLRELLPKLEKGEKELIDDHTARDLLKAVRDAMGIHTPSERGRLSAGDKISTLKNRVVEKIKDKTIRNPKVVKLYSDIARELAVLEQPESPISRAGMPPPPDSRGSMTKAVLVEDFSRGYTDTLRQFLSDLKKTSKEMPKTVDSDYQWLYDAGEKIKASLEVVEVDAISDAQVRNIYKGIATNMNEARKITYNPQVHQRLLDPQPRLFECYHEMIRLQDDMLRDIDKLAETGKASASPPPSPPPSPK